MITGSIARRYAKAVMELGAANNSTDKLGADLHALAGALKTSAELVTVLNNPAIRRADRKRVLDALLHAHRRADAAHEEPHLLAARRRRAHEQYLEGISREVDAMIAAKSGRVVAEVTSAKPLDPAQLTQITAALEKLSGKKVDITKKQDPELLGGVVAKVGDVVYDGSLRTQLRNLRDELTK